MGLESQDKVKSGHREAAPGQGLWHPQELPREAMAPWAATGLLHSPLCAGQARG